MRSATADVQRKIKDVYSNANEDLIQCFENIWDSHQLPSERREPWPCCWNIRTEVLSGTFSPHQATCGPPLCQAPEEQHRFCPHQREHPAVWTGHTKHQLISIPVSIMIITMFMISFTLFDYNYDFSSSFTETLSIPWVRKAVALCQQRDVGYSVQRIVKGLQKRRVYVVEICHSPCFIGACNIC